MPRSELYIRSGCAGFHRDPGEGGVQRARGAGPERDRSQASPFRPLQTCPGPCATASCPAAGQGSLAPPPARAAGHGGTRLCPPAGPCRGAGARSPRPAVPPTPPSSASPSSSATWPRSSTPSSTPSSRPGSRGRGPAQEAPRAPTRTWTRHLAGSGPLGQEHEPGNGAGTLPARGRGPSQAGGGPSQASQHPAPATAATPRPATAARGSVGWSPWAGASPRRPRAPRRHHRPQGQGAVSWAWGHAPGSCPAACSPTCRAARLASA